MIQSQNYIYGRNAVLEAMEAGNPIEKIYIAFGTQGDPVNKIYKIAKSLKIPCVQYDKRKFAALEKQAFPEGIKTQGVIAQVKLIETLDIHELIAISYRDSKLPVLVVLDGITDPQNLGAIARSCECAGAAGLILPERNTAPVTPVAVKSSAGALEHIPVARVTNLSNTLEKLKESGFWIVGTDASGDKKYTDDNYGAPVVLVIGSEGRGMRDIVRKQCDFVVNIPLRGRINSLNSSVAAGVMLFEINRQRSL